jgi:CO/xanthine dehydrogenase Mo-binding subunit
VKRIDAPKIVTGSATYGIDVRVPGMLYATLIRPPVLGAKPVGVDSSAAARVSGFRSHVIPVAGGVAVVATNTWAAIKARRAVKVNWDTSAARPFNSEQHWQALERALAEPGVVTRREGDAGATQANGRTIEARYHYPFEAHATLEPMNCTAHVHDGRCEIWVPTQAPNALQERVGRLLGMDVSRVTVTPTLIGGGFGRRLAVDYALEAAELSQKISAPVQLLWTREDDMKHGHFQNASVHQMSAVLDEAGRPVAWRHKKAASLHNLSGPPTAEDLKDPVAYYQDSSWGVYDIPYDIGAIETSYVNVDVPLRIGPWRAVFSPSSTFARECFIDELAHAAGKDPIEFRLSLLGGADTVKAGGLTIDRRRLRRVLELVREKSGWLSGGRARGVACNVYDGETHVAYVAEVSVPRTTRPGYLPFVVHRMVCAIDCGVVINPLGIEQQVEGAVIWALSNMKGEITVRNGSVEQSNFVDFPVARMSEAPVIETHIVPSHGDQPFGVGEPPVPPAIPAIVNALFAVTGRRIRRLPVRARDVRG